jgi:sRNA-binding protein
MTPFFSAKKSPGRPAKKTPKSERPASEKAPAPAAAQEAAAIKPKVKKPKATRTSYFKGEGLMKMTNAEVYDIPLTILQTHITPNHSKRIKLGSGVGRKPIFDDQWEAIIVDVLVRKDRANEGASVGEAAGILKKMCTDYSRKQLDQASRRTVRPQYSERMTDPVAAQATTIKRTAITPAQQWRWQKVKY